MNRHARPFPILAALAVLATLLVIVGPLVSRWQLYGVMPPAVAEPQAVSAAGPAPEAMPGMHHHHHAAMSEQAALPAVVAQAVQPVPALPADPHAGHDMGVDCDYCLLAARLLPWLVFALLILPLLRAPAPRVFKVLGRVGKAWHGHLGARGPPAAPGLTLIC